MFGWLRRNREVEFVPSGSSYWEKEREIEELTEEDGVTLPQDYLRRISGANQVPQLSSMVEKRAWGLQPTANPATVLPPNVAGSGRGTGAGLEPLPIFTNGTPITPERGGCASTTPALAPTPDQQQPVFIVQPPPLPAVWVALDQVFDLPIDGGCCGCFSHALIIKFKDQIFTYSTQAHAKLKQTFKKPSYGQS